MKVLKFGGSSVADASRISQVMDIVHDALKHDRVVLVCSAVSGCTDELIKMGKLMVEIDETGNPDREDELEYRINELAERHYRIIDRLFTGKEQNKAIDEIYTLLKPLYDEDPAVTQTYGEMLSTSIISRKFACEGVETCWLDSRDLIYLKKDGTLDEDRTYKSINKAVSKYPDVRLFVAPGFIASDHEGYVTDLGRGGSDYSAAIYAAALHARTLEIWTDVPGIMTANPKVVSAAVTIPRMSYQAAADMAASGAKVLYAPTVEPARKAGIDIYIKNTFDPGNAGTLITGCAGDRGPVGVSSLRSTANPEISTVCVVGDSGCERHAIIPRILTALENTGISPVSDVYGSGDVFSVDVRWLVEKNAVQALHREFFEEQTLSSIDLYIAGYGAVGRALAIIAEMSRERIQKRTGKTLNIVGVADSRKFCIDPHGLQRSEIASRLAEGDDNSDGAFLKAVCESAQRRAVLIDCTGSDILYRDYEALMRSGLNIVTSNRRSLAIPYVQYAALRRCARENGVFFRYDTTVGNALPVLESIAGSANCSDGIEGIEAVVSCTMNYIITSYNGTKGDSLAELFRKAQEAGLTEVDPRTDLGGKDALRKLLILAREAGIPLEAADVEITPMLGSEFFDCSLDEFYARLEAAEPRFIAREAELDAAGHRRQRFVASVVRDPSARLGFKATIRIQEVTQDSPFYYISGTENVIVVRSEHSAPLVLKGAGEGAETAASGIIQNILE